MSKFYTGIGSRETPTEVLELMKDIAKKLSYSFNYILRSGHADGADTAFEEGCDSVHGSKEIYIPWKGFNSSFSTRYHITEEAYYLAKKYHPYWDKLSEGAMKLQARNGYQVLGENLSEQSEFIICYTKDGKEVGGTAQAVRIAKDLNIPIFNIGSYSEIETAKNEFWRFLQQIILRR